MDETETARAPSLGPSPNQGSSYACSIASDISSTPARSEKGKIYTNLEVLEEVRISWVFNLNNAADKKGRKTCTTMIGELASNPPYVVNKEGERKAESLNPLAPTFKWRGVNRNIN